MAHAPPSRKRKQSHDHDIHRFQGKESILTSQIELYIEDIKPKIPDGGWGWMIVFSAFLLNAISEGISFSFGLLYIPFLNEFEASKSATSWVGSLFLAMPLLADLSKEFWMGLQNIYHIPDSDVYELLVEIVDRDKVKAYAHYDTFRIGSEMERNPLKAITDFSGDAGDALSYHKDDKFSTKDMDQDKSTSNNCAENHKGAWWYYGCYKSSLNGKYLNTPLTPQMKQTGIHWETFRGQEYCHASTRMLVQAFTV